jgi:SagB-type dehydrogenase family enzyme
VILLMLCLPLACTLPISPGNNNESSSEIVNLPEPTIKGNISLEAAISARRSMRQYTDSPLTLNEVSQLLWSAQGITSEWGGRTVPSAGGLNPLEIYLVSGNVIGLHTGQYHYIPKTLDLVRITDNDMRDALSEASLNQSCVRDGAVDIIIAAIYPRTTTRYGDRGIRYVHMEAGHASQNIYLQAAALGLGTVAVGAFNDKQVASVLNLNKDCVPLYIMPVGKLAQ